MPIGKRDEICAAALRLFVEKGIASTTTREIAHRANTAEGNLYRYFKGKSHIAQFVFEQCASRLWAALLAETEGRESAAERLKALVRGMFDFSRAEPDAFRFILMSHHGRTIRLDDLNGQTLPKELFVDVIRSGVASGEFRNVDPLLATGWIVGMTQRAILFLDTGRMDTDPGEVADETVKGALLLVGNVGMEDGQS